MDADALRHAAEQRARRDQLAASEQTASALVSQREAELRELTEKLRIEAADVRRLERFSPAQVWGLLRGDIDDRLSVERAEHQAAEHAVAGAGERLAHAQAELDRIRTETAALGDVDAAFDAALDEREQELRRAGSDAADELVRLETEAGALAAETRELAEATAALSRASDALAAAQSALDSAGGWSTYDTFFGGGMVADMIKHERIGESARAFTVVNRALESLSSELADIDAPPLEGVRISETLAVFDVLFDNIFSDWSVRERISEAQNASADLRHRLTGLGRYLADRSTAVTERATARASRREALLLGG